MPGTVIGGKHAAETNKKRHGSDFYQKIGKLGGAKSRGGGFASNRELARVAGRRGGSASRRTAIKKVETEAKVTEKEQSLWKRLRNL